MQNLIGKQIDRYQIIEQVGQGGMAVVYRALDVRLEREVALKIIRIDEIPASQHARLLKRFEREAKAMAKFAHAHIVPVFDYGEHLGTPYLVMAFLAGGTLKDAIKTGGMAWRQALATVLPVADALGYAHSLGVIHRDIKPGNIMFDQSKRAVLTDFGIAKILETDDTTLTGTGLGVGTPEYMAPEQWKGQAGAASDQYALGVVLYELLTGQKPYTAETPVAVALKQMSEPIRRPGELVAGVPESVEQVLLRALAREAGGRHADMAAFRQALEQCLGAGEVVIPHQVTPPVMTGSEDETRDIFEMTPLETAEPVKALESVHAAGQQEERRIELAEGVWMAFVHVPGGAFLMGAGAEDGYAEADEKPQHRVHLDGYWMGKVTVTNAQYACYRAAQGKRHIYMKHKADYPVVNVRWQDAVAFCAWASAQSGMMVRLPTEAEWEKAARGTDGRLYPWGNEAPNAQLAVFNTEDVRVVGSCPAGTSAYGALDMAGNVWEWVSDWYAADYYANAPDENPTGPASGEYRVLRGGSWFNSVRNLRASVRFRFFPDYADFNLGFRCLTLD